MRRLQGLFCIAMSIVPLLAPGVQAQVDWGPLLGEQGAQPTREMPQHEPPGPTVQPQGSRTPRVRDTAPAAPKPRTRRRVQTPRSRRQVKQEPSEEREYPAAPGGRR
jgi:hypothetical protein